ncbi:MAG TPA: secondary thiamine-phosphate synthase enzyme YjbQ [Tepidisphaeraceae bacterium]|nr:secondary thiamine-phosphate synthase enzyme YjbQ [Tepidisphaeraceae bacterium]
MMQAHPLVKEPVRTGQRSQIIDLTDAVRRIVRQRKVTDGMVVLYVPHTTAGVTINENYDPDVKHDLLRKLDALIPKNEPYYQHDEGNSDSHLKTALVGNSATVLIDHGDLVLGRWQGIYFCEFDGPREREVYVKVVDFRARGE